MDEFSDPKRLKAWFGDPKQRAGEELAAALKSGPVRYAPEPTPATTRKHSHYFRPCPFDEIDIYRVLVLFNVTDPCLGHALKKIMLAGGRGGLKSMDKDVQEAIDTLLRWQEMRAEERRE